MPEAKLYQWDTVPLHQAGERFERQVVSGERMMIARVHFKTTTGTVTHRHELEQMTVCFRGEITFTIDGKQHVLGPGSVLVIPSNLEHGVTVTKDDTEVWDLFSPPRQEWLTGAGEAAGQAANPTTPY